MDVTESDLAELAGYFLSTFAIGFAGGFILRVLRRAVETVR